MAPQTSSRSTKGLVSSRRGDKGCNIVRGKENHADADMAAKIKPNVTSDWLKAYSIKPTEAYNTPCIVRRSNNGNVRIKPSPITLYPCKYERAELVLEALQLREMGYWFKHFYNGNSENADNGRSIINIDRRDVIYKWLLKYRHNGTHDEGHNSNRNVLSADYGNVPIKPSPITLYPCKRGNPQQKSLASVRRQSSGLVKWLAFSAFMSIR